jgi:hypothetical protein
MVKQKSTSGASLSKKQKTAGSQIPQTGAASTSILPKDFLSLCSQDSIHSQIPSTLAACKEYLSRAEVQPDLTNLSKGQAVELAAALVWARNHLDNPAEWEALDASLRTTLSSLYRIPKPQRAAQHLSAMERLAQQIRSFLTPPPSPTSRPQGGSSINTVRPVSSAPGSSGSIARSDLTLQDRAADLLGSRVQSHSDCAHLQRGCLGVPGAVRRHCRVSRCHRRPPPTPV